MRWTLPVELGWENAPKWKDGGRAHAAPGPGVSCLDGTASGSWFPQPEGDLKNSKKGAQKRGDPLRGRARGRDPSCLSSCQIAVRKKRWLVFGFFFFIADTPTVWSKSFPDNDVTYFPSLIQLSCLRIQRDYLLNSPACFSKPSCHPDVREGKTSAQPLNRVTVGITSALFTLLLVDLRSPA